MVDSGWGSRRDPGYMISEDYLAVLLEHAFLSPKPKPQFSVAFPLASPSSSLSLGASPRIVDLLLEDIFQDVGFLLKTGRWCRQVVSEVIRAEETLKLQAFPRILPDCSDFFEIGSLCVEPN